jgi:cell division protein FtsL
MARSSAATVAPPPAKRRKPTTKAGTRNPHASTQTHRRPERRSSGPASGRTSTARKRPAAAAGGRSPAAATTVAPRRAPQPRRSASTSTARPRRQPAAAPLVQRLIHGRTGAVLDRLLRGRACVGLVFVLLVGIVFFNVALLQLNEGIAQTSAKSTALEQENAKLRRELAPLASSERIQTEAVKRGFSLPAAGDVSFVRGDVTTNAKRAAARMTAPGMGEGTASRPAALVEQETAQSPTAPAAVTPAPQSTQAAPATTAAPTTPVSATPQSANSQQSAQPQSAIPPATVP